MINGTSSTVENQTLGKSFLNRNVPGFVKPTFLAKKWLFVLGGVLFVGSLLFVSRQSRITRKQTPILSKLVPSIPTMISPTPIAKDDAWKTYKNKTAYFEVQYPSDWIVFEENDRLAIATFPREQAAQGVFVPRGEAYIVIYTENKGDYSSFEEFVNQKLAYQEVIHKSAVNINGYPGYQIKAKMDMGAFVFMEYFTTIINGKNDYLYLSLNYYQGDPKQQEYQDVYYEIVSSLQFVPSSGERPAYIIESGYFKNYKYHYQIRTGPLFNFNVFDKNDPAVIAINNESLEITMTINAGEDFLPASPPETVPYLPNSLQETPITVDGVKGKVFTAAETESPNSTNITNFVYKRVVFEKNGLRYTIEGKERARVNFIEYMLQAFKFLP